MLLTELTSVPDAALPLQALKNQLRLGTGFGEDSLQDGLLAGMIRAAMATIEGRIGKVLIARQFQLRIEDWRSLDNQPLPVAPVTGVVSVKLVDGAGGEVAVPSDRWRLVPDGHRPSLAAAGVLFPTVPTGGHVDVVFGAGFAATWAGVPADLAQAVLMLAATYYEERHDGGVLPAGLPFAVQAMIERWRSVRVLGGGAA